jgi:hypothetical protein
MENLLDLITENDNNPTRVPTLSQSSFPFRICDIALPHCKTGFVYFLISIKSRDYTYIGECKCIVTRLYNHNSGHGSSSTIPSHRRPFAILGYICGFNGDNKHLPRLIERQWKEKRDFIRNIGIVDPRQWFRIGSNVISELDGVVYEKQKKEWCLVELFKD